MKKRAKNIRVGIFRHLINRPGEPSHDSPFALELHNRRKEFLHDLLDKNEDWKVVKWDKGIDDKRSHEYVEMILQLATDPYFQTIGFSIVTFIGVVVGGVASNTAGNLLSDEVKKLFRRFRKAQEEEKIQDISLELPGGSRVTIIPAGTDADVIVQKRGKNVTIKFSELGLSKKKR